VINYFISLSHDCQSSVTIEIDKRRKTAISG
jgi:hypothetical protein